MSNVVSIERMVIFKFKLRAPLLRDVTRCFDDCRARAQQPGSASANKVWARETRDAPLFPAPCESRREVMPITILLFEHPI